MKKKSLPKSFSILFGGESRAVELIDGSTLTVFVRALPQRYLAHVLAAAEWPHALTELCTYLPAAAAVPATPPAFPDVVPPAGYVAVPAGWADNLSDESARELFELAQELNFQRAIAWGRAAIAQKRLVAPIHEEAMEQVKPLVAQVMAPLMKKFDDLLSSMPKSQPSPAAATASSS